MSQEVKQKSIHYKRAVVQNSAATLQNLLEQAIGKGGMMEKVESRQESLNPNDSNGGFRFLNKSSNYRSIFFGQLISFEKGKSQALLTMSGGASYYDIKSITSSEIEMKTSAQDSEELKEEVKREFIDSFLYFGVLGNHIVMMQSSSLKSRELEQHLNWLLGLSGSLGDNGNIILQDRPTEEAFEKLKSSPVKSIKIGSPIKGRSELDVKGPQELQTVNQVKRLKFMPKGRGGDVIAAALGENWVEDLNLEDALDEANLQVNLEITYIRKTTKRGQRVIDSIATSLRHLDSDDVKIDLKGGGTLKGNDLKLSGKIGVKYFNGLVDDDDLFLKMHHWLSSKINVGEIS